MFRIKFHELYKYVKIKNYNCSKKQDLTNPFDLSEILEKKINH